MRRGRPIGTMNSYIYELSSDYDMVIISKYASKKALADLDDTVPLRNGFIVAEKAEPISFNKYKYKIFCKVKLTLKNLAKFKILKENSEYGVYDFIILSIQKRYKTKYDQEK